MGLFEKRDETQKFQVYDWVYIFRDNKIKKMQVYEVRQKMSFDKRGTDFCYGLVPNWLGAGVGNNQPYEVREDDVFSSEEEAKLAFLDQALDQ